MQSKVKKPSLFRIITTDYSSFLTLIAPIVAWGLLGVLSLLPDPLTRENLPIMLSIAIIVTGLGIILFIWRVWTIWSTLTQGTEVPGQIVNVSFFRDRGRVEYTYTYQGQTYRRGNGVMKMQRTEVLEPNNEVMLTVHPKHPKRAFIRDLYFS